MKSTSNTILLGLRFKAMLILVCLGFSAIQALAQNAILTLPPRYYNPVAQTFQLLPTQSWGYNGQASDFAHAGMQDANGGLKFFVVDHSVYDHDGYLIEELWGANPFSSFLKPLAEVTIVPDPANCDRYYIFGATKSVFCGFSSELPYYALLDLSLPNVYNSSRKGALIPFHQDLSGVPSYVKSIDSLVTGLNQGDPKQGGCYFAASKVRSNHSRFVFISNGYGIYRFKIDASGFQYDNYHIPFHYPSFNQQRGARAEMELVELSNGNYRLAVPYLNAGNGGLPGGHSIFMVELNPSGVQIGAMRLITLPSASIGNDLTMRGLEFSPDGSYLYFTHTIDPLSPHTVQYYRWANGSVGAFTTIANPSDYEYSQIELGKGGKMLIPSDNKFLIISNMSANSPGTTSLYPFPTGVTYSPSYLTCSTSNFRKSFTMADQIDGMNYLDHYFANPQCCINNSTYTRNAYTATTSGTWKPGATLNPFGSINGVVTIRNELRIPAGKTVTIQNMTFKFAPGAKVVVERGNGVIGSGAINRGRLILQGTRFTSESGCDNKAMWMGVEVQGHPTLNQTGQHILQPGRVDILDNSIIENAVRGVVASRMTLVGGYPYTTITYDFNYAGGVVSASNSTFRNNIVDVYLPNYIAPNQINNLSSFSRCIFETDGNLPNPAYNPLYHAQLSQVKGVSFFGCTFINRTPSLYAANRKGEGIHSTDAQFWVDRYCSTISTQNACVGEEKGKFENLNIGIWAYSTSLKTAAIGFSKFIDCNYGILMEGLRYPIIIRSTFEPLDFSQVTCGIYMNNCDGYKVEENDFGRYGPHFQKYGIIVSNSGTAHNEIYRNRFRSLRVGIQAEGVNGSSFAYGDPNSSNQGLQFRCNFFYGDYSVADMAVHSGKIDYQQGYCLPATNAYASSAPAGNTFSHSTLSPASDFAAHHLVQPFNYAHHSDRAPLYYTSSIITPQQCASPSNPVPFDGINSCPSKISSQGGGNRSIHLHNALQHQVQKTKIEQTTRNVDEVQLELQFLTSLIQFEIDEYIRAALFDSTSDFAVADIENDPELKQFQSYFRHPVLSASFSIHSSHFRTEDIVPIDSIQLAHLPDIGLWDIEGHAVLAGTKRQPSAVLHIAPNPSTGQFTLTSDLDITGDILVTLSDLSGRRILQQSFRDIAQPISISCPECAKGTYFVSVTLPDHSTTNFKVLIQ
jgi:Secretion system C-terminal sorting domain